MDQRFDAESECFVRLAVGVLADVVDEVALPAELVAELVQLGLELSAFSVDQRSQKQLVSLVSLLPS